MLKISSKNNNYFKAIYDTYCLTNLTKQILCCIITTSIKCKLKIFITPPSVGKKTEQKKMKKYDKKTGMEIIFDEEFKMKIKVHTGIGPYDEIIKRAIAKAKEENCFIKSELNKSFVVVAGDSDADLILRDVRRAEKGYIPERVGPYPEINPSEEEIAEENECNIARDIAEKKYSVIQKREYGKISKKQLEELKKEIATCPPMERNEEEWQKGINEQKGSEYGLACYEFAEYWARLMQKGISEGKQLKYIAEDCAAKVNIYFSTSGAMYGLIRGILIHKPWKHQKEFKKWNQKRDSYGFFHKLMKKISEIWY